MDSSPKKILIINNSADIYGASRCLLRLAYSLDPGRFEVIVALPYAGPLFTLLQEAGIHTVIIPQISAITRAIFKSPRLAGFLITFPFRTLSLVRFIRQHQIQLVHTNTGVIINGALAAKLTGAKHVWHIRDWFGEFGAFWKYYSKYILTLSNNILCVSRAIANQFPASDCVCVVHDGFPIEEFEVNRKELKREFRTKFSLGDGLLIGVVGRIKYQRKGQEYFVQAAKILKDRGIHAKYLIVGSPAPGSEDHLSRLESLIRELGLQEDIIITGELTDAKPAYAAMDISVLSSAQPEPFAGVNIESMAMSLPVVATNIGGSPDQIADGKTGFLCNPGDPQDMADKLEVLCRDSELRLKMGNAGRERVLNEFSLEAMVRQIEAIYTKVLS